MITQDKERLPSRVARDETNAAVKTMKPTKAITPAAATPKPRLTIDWPSSQISLRNNVSFASKKEARES